MQRIVIVGCGYVGGRFARLCRQRGDHVTTISRDATRIGSLELADTAIQHDWSDSHLNWRIDQPIDLLLCSVSHRVESDRAGHQSNLHSRCLANLLRGFSNAPKRIIYLSTTGVYQSTDSGDWFDENSPCLPERPGSKNAYDAELWLTAHWPKNSVILRPAGIYGPDRIPNLDALRGGEPIAANPHSYLNLIHVEDLVQIISHVAAVQSVPHSIYNVSDGTPVLRSDYYGYLTKQLNAPDPVYVPKGPVSGSTIRSRGQGSKRIDANRLKRDFPISLIYPNYEVGLRPLLADDIAVPNA